MACSKALASSLALHSVNRTPNFVYISSSLSILSPPCSSHSSFTLTIETTPPPFLSSSLLFSVSSPKTKQICRAAEYTFPDPIPEFAESETEKFKTHLLKKLTKKDIYGESIEEVVGICTEIFSTFLHTEYGGPGTLLVIPFIDMADTLTERGLPGAPQAARASVVWAQKHVDRDWNEWTGNDD